MPHIKATALGAWAAIISGIAFGINSIIVKVASNLGLTTLDLILYQFGFALTYFSVKYLFVRKISNTRQTNIKLMKNPYNWLASITAVSTGFFYYIAIQITDPSIASLGLFQYPWILFLMGFFLSKDRIISKQVIAIILIIVGTVMLIGGTLVDVTILGLFFGFLAAISFATCLYSLQKTTDHPFTKVFIFTIATVLVLIFCLLKYENLHIFTLNALLFGFITAILGRIITFELLSYAAKNISFALLATLPTSELPVTMVLTWCIWDSFPSAIQIFGLIIMIIAIVWLKFERLNSATS